jgi:hypothetical protein
MLKNSLRGSKARYAKEKGLISPISSANCTVIVYPDAPAEIFRFAEEYMKWKGIEWRPMKMKYGFINAHGSFFFDLKLKNYACIKAVTNHFVIPSGNADLASQHPTGLKYPRSCRDYLGKLTSILRSV